MCFLLLQKDSLEMNYFRMADHELKIFMEIVQSSEVETGKDFQDYLHQYLLKTASYQHVFTTEASEAQLHIILNEEAELPEDGFRIEVEARITVIAKNIRGLLYGVYTLGKTIFEKGKIPFGNYLSEPRQKERALMIDIGRKYFTKEWLFKVIEYMHEWRLNTLQLHFSDNEGFRIASECFPEIVSEAHLTKEEIKEIIDYANFYQIDIVPELDTPGHVVQILANFPQFHMPKIEDGQPTVMPHGLKIYDPEARNFVKTLLKEYAELFAASKYFHIGADEFIDINRLQKYPGLVSYAKEHYGEGASGIETYVEYTNDLIEYITNLGFIPRVWNDGFYRKNRPSLLPLDTRAQITYWTRWDENMAEVSDFIKKGHQVINFNDNYFYYVVGETESYSYPSAEKISEKWQIEKFSREQTLNAKEMKAVLGTTFAIWCDHPNAQTELEVYEGMKCPLAEMAKKLWETREG